MSILTDGLGRRSQQTIGGAATDYVHYGLQVGEKRAAGGTTRLFYRAGTDELIARQNASGLASFFVTDHLGSIAAETSASGQLILSRSYDPWGNLDVASASISGFAFTGREWDSAVGQYDLRARQYSPAAGRFVSEDPTTFDAGPNFYSYVSGNPVNVIDPSGLRGVRVEWRTCVGAINNETREAHCGNGKNSIDDRSCRVAHCVANCVITRECVLGRQQAAVAGYLKEIYDEVKKRTWNPKTDGWDPGDLDANRCGRDFGAKFRERRCPTLCKDVR